MFFHYHYFSCFIYCFISFHYFYYLYIYFYIYIYIYVYIFLYFILFYFFFSFEKRCSGLVVSKAYQYQNSSSFITIIPNFGVSTAIMLSRRYLPQVVHVEFRILAWKWIKLANNKSMFQLMSNIIAFLPIAISYGHFFFFFFDCTKFCLFDQMNLFSFFMLISYFQIKNFSSQAKRRRNKLFCAVIPIKNTKPL